MVVSKTRSVVICCILNLFFEVHRVLADNRPLITTDQGDLLGAYHHTTNGRQYAAFLSLPFAKPPTGALRFKAPVEAENWNGVRDASQDAPICIQSNPYVRVTEVSGVEDCLYLNVYTPKIKTEEDGALLPVMIFFHGGGWVTGSGNKAFYGPDRLLDRDVVLVGVNYRLGALGLLSTSDAAAPGNWLFKDQNMALKWVQKHISKFGGDPNLVTIFGESAGAVSVHYHMMSPKSKGLFHRAILHSGSALCDWANSAPGQPLKQAKKLGDVLNCPTDDNELMVECLRSKNAEDIIEADKYFYHWDFDPMIPFRPVVEPQNEDSFLTEDPRVILSEGRFAQVPMMTGLNENEGAIRSAAIFGIPGLLEELAENFDDLAPVTFAYRHSDKCDVITKAIKKYYLKDGPLDESAIMNLTDIYSDAYFTAGLDEALTLMLPHSSKPIYLYYFTYRGKHSFSEIFGDANRNYGACHVDELMYIFNIGLFPELEERDVDMSDTVLSIWTNFAASGNPEMPVSNTKLGKIPSWQPLTSPDKWVHLKIGNELDLHDSLFEARKRFWRELPLWHKQHSAIYKKQIKTEL